ncbi:hypothetical protein DXX93_14760 [Thalassotalea euphylliae]|uniref:Carboxypeptidase regulatory-like domain-containing protein n=1 Tax=Thalassotalea euphylliae TaxID=1655234 RepID=A0A3E0TT98_9GAMM|nr:hypothetical protein [Thalassotalea euphylliae]REL27693.1 hypothetical protein DXX93_14760 [Thalassotalea euphylliae]
MKPKDGKAITAVQPIDPEEVFEADEASPGKVAKVKAEQQQRQSGKYGVTPIVPFQGAAGSANQTENSEQEEAPSACLEIELVDEQDQPLAGEKYQVELPDGTMAKGTLDNKGYVKIAGFEPGNCQVSFPDIDSKAWEKA